MVSNQSEIIGHVLKMVVALRHEFGRNIDVKAIVQDEAYARSVVELAVGSKNEHLREQAQYLERMIWGPRESAAALETPAPADATAGASGGGDEAQAGAVNAAEVLNAAKLAKYRHGLR